MKKFQKVLPPELVSDFINFVPFNMNWAKIRISRSFDLFFIKLHQKLFVFYKAGVVDLFSNIVKKFEDIEKADLVYAQHVFLDNDFDIIHNGLLELSSDATELNKAIRNYKWPKEVSRGKLTKAEFLKVNVERMQKFLKTIFLWCKEEVKGVMDTTSVMKWKYSALVLQGQMQFIRNKLFSDDH